MAKKQTDANTAEHINAQPRLHQRAREIQPYGTVNHALPLDLEEPVRLGDDRAVEPTPRGYDDPARSI